MRDEQTHEWTAEPEAKAEAARRSQREEEPPNEELPTASEAEAVPEPTPEPSVPAPTGPAARYAALERIEDDPDKPYFVTDWNGHRNYHCRECADQGKHFASTRLERTVGHIAERHLPHEVDLGLVTPTGRPLRIRR